MSIQFVRNIFESLTTCDAWSLQLLKITTSTRNGTSYLGREIRLSPDGQLKELVMDIRNKYIGEKPLIDSFIAIRDYDGSSDNKTIYKLSVHNELIESEYINLIEALAEPDFEADPFSTKFQAYLIKGNIAYEGERKDVKIICMKSPVTVLKRKYSWTDKSFKNISGKVISLKDTIDVIIFNDTVYMLTLDGERLFDMERSYRNVCIQKLKAIEALNIVDDYEFFSKRASTGHNPRRFVSFEDKYLERLKNLDERSKIAKNFTILFNGEKFETTQNEEADKLVKVLCGKGGLDPFGENPMEVDGAREWR